MEYEVDFLTILIVSRECEKDESMKRKNNYEFIIIYNFLRRKPPIAHKFQ